MQHSKFHEPSPRQLPAASSTDELQQEADSTSRFALMRIGSPASPSDDQSSGLQEATSPAGLWADPVCCGRCLPVIPVADEEYVPDKEEIMLYVDDGFSWNSEQLEVVTARGPSSPDRVVNVEEEDLPPLRANAEPAGTAPSVAPPFAVSPPGKRKREDEASLEFIFYKDLTKPDDDRAAAPAASWRRHT
ncbi:hypothetical protein SELMODRAFT_428396 [Selaginella moellendorffii]|uniref:Uncharacterized protein n=1 Tax=Selaginella moellendorffii TaxID=88036 RepID=D8T2P1_SELML|nr:hypothetical protein SELMODRAFT_428396 [Selaginella moellendorffii]